MSGQYNSASDYLRSLSEMADGNYTSFYRSLNGQVMFPETDETPHPLPEPTIPGHVSGPVPKPV